MLYRQMDELTLKHVIFTVIGAVLAYIFVSLNPIAMNRTLPILFMSGLIAICAMILPGISGSFLLLLLGQYEYMLNALKTMSLSEIVVFCAGALIGILGFSKVLNYLLEHHEGITMAFSYWCDDRYIKTSCCTYCKYNSSYICSIIALYYPGYYWICYNCCYGN
ncbi:MAG: DUF368 domain-containing protein [Ruminococcus sp.]